MARILHITPHLGGGVGKAVTGLIRQSMQQGDHRHVVLCLEKPEKTQFSGLLEDLGCPTHYCPSRQELLEEIRAADIVQVEFWNHPALVEALCSIPLPEMRLLVWCHISGLRFPAIPRKMIEESGRFLFTSPCSLEMLKDGPALPGVAVASSGGGMDEMPPLAPRPAGRPFTCGYLGTLNLSKLHPDFVAFAAAVPLPGFSIRMIGDEVSRDVLERQCNALGRPGLLEFCGYRPDVAAELAQLDALIYLLNPNHYGTAENTLLEAMAMGVVPIVLDNAAERHIVDHGRTGIIVRTPEDLAREVAWLADREAERAEIGRRAADTVRQHHTYERMARTFDDHYRGLMEAGKQAVSFTSIFGQGPADWFMAFQPNPSFFSGDGEVRIPLGPERHALFERTKGSVFHFLDYFPDDPLLLKWADAVQREKHVPTP